MHLSRPIKVIHLVNTLDTGGLERVVLDLVRHADRTKVQPQVACLLESGDLHEEFVAEGIVPHSLGLNVGTVFSRALRLSRFFRKLEVEVVHTHNSGPHIVGSLAARLARVPVILHTRHGRNHGATQRAMLANRIASYFSSHVVVVSHDTAEVARRVERIPPSRLSVVHNGIDVDSFAVTGEPRSPRPATRAIHVARLNKVKDQTTLLKAARIVVDSEPTFTLDIVGDGPVRQDLEELRSLLQLEEQVRFLGMRTDVAGLLAASDFFVLSSISEGISLSLLEAMAAKLAIVATDVGGNREVVDHLKTGLLVPSSNPQALAEGILSLIRNPGDCGQWGMAGREKVERQFNIRRVVKDYQSLYESLLLRKSGLAFQG